MLSSAENTAPAGNWLCGRFVLPMTDSFLLLPPLPDPLHCPTAPPPIDNVILGGLILNVHGLHLTVDNEALVWD